MRYRFPATYRRGFTRGLAALLMLSAVGSTPDGRLYGSEARRTAEVRIVEKARSSIVNIHGQKTLRPTDDGFRAGEPPQRVNGMGTGVVIDQRGYIITNHHVVDGVGRIQVTMADGKSYTATLIAHDATTDLAVIKIAAPDDLPLITIGTSADLMPGEPVIAVGNAYGYENTVTRGIISALHRTVQVSDAQNYQDLIQTDASINPGNSGGPLFNIDGEMIGINVAVRAGAQGIGFAIPVDSAMMIAGRLMSAERVDGLWHGIRADKNSDVASHSVTIEKVDADSPAAKIGLKAGDIITSINDQKVARTLDLERGMIGRHAGDEVAMTVERDGKSIQMSMELASTPKKRTGTGVDRTWEQIGLQLEQIPANRFNAQASSFRGGLSVAAVRADSPASRQGIKRGDILVGIHNYETVSLENVSWILAQPNLADIEPVKFYILRGKAVLYGHIQVASQPQR